MVYLRKRQAPQAVYCLLPDLDCPGGRRDDKSPALELEMDVDIVS